MTSHKKDLLSTIITIAIIIIVCGAFWWLVAVKFIFPKEKAITTPTPAPQQQTESLDENSDEISTLEAEINSVDLTDLDKELSEIEAEINQP